MILGILSAIPDRILRYEEYRKVSEAVSVPLEVLWGADKANLDAAKERSSERGNAREFGCVIRSWRHHLQKRGS